TRPPLISSSRTISPLVSGPPGCLRHSAAPHLVFPNNFTARLGAARVPPALGRPSSRLPEQFHRSSRGRPGASGTRPPLISSSRTISPLVSGPPGCLRHSAAPHLVFPNNFTARLGAARVPPALGRPSSRLPERFHRSSRGRPGASGT